MGETLRTFFETNRIIVYSVYGQVFFTMGILLAFQSLRHSRLQLARALPWLALFGISHGLHEWGDVFIPVQATYLPSTLVDLLRIAQVFLLAFSFLCLCQFGVATLSPLPPRWRWVFWAPGAIFVLWVLGPFYGGLTRIPSVLPDIAAWHRVAAALARYSLGLPGGLMAAYGLRVHAHRHIAPLELPQIIRTLRIAGLAMAGYGIAGGLIGPAVPFFPGDRLNETTMLQALGIPMPVWRSVLGLILLAALAQALEVFQVEMNRRIEEMERMNIMAMERERLARDLHDHVLQQLYAAGLMAEALRERVGTDAATVEIADRLLAALNRAVEDIRMVLSTMQRGLHPGRLRSLLAELASDPRFSSLVHVETHLEVPDLPLDPVQAAHLAAILSEALSNAVRHARARRVRVEAQMDSGRCLLRIQDDGVGMALDRPEGMGLRSMRERALLLGGFLRIESAPGQGTCVCVEFPVERRS